MAEKKQVLFGGTPEAPPPEVFAEARKNWSPEYRVFETAIDSFRKSPDNKNRLPASSDQPATIEQVWNFFALLGKFPYCLLCTDQPEVDTGNIKKVIKLNSHQLVTALKQISTNEGNLSCSLLHYDGHTGHCINVQYYKPETDRFVYYDPWPLESLLCSKNNMAGVDAVEEEQRVWSVTATELESVVFAAFIFPPVWERMQNNLHALRLDDLKDTDFFTFFHLKELAVYQNKKGKEVQYSPANFQGIVIVSFSINGTGRIEAIKLFMNKVWAKENFMLVPDITGSFLKTFVPAKDIAAYKVIIDSLQVNNFMKVLPALIKAGSSGVPADEILLAYAGVRPHASLPADFSSLTVHNKVINEVPWLEITLDLY